MKKITLILIFISIHFGSIAQGKYQIGTLPTLNINKKLENNWQINFKSEFRQLFKEGSFGKNNTGEYIYVHTDAAFIASKKVGLNNKLAGGFLLRFKNKDVIKRAIQQFTIITRYNSFRLGQRFASDQTFKKNESIEWRLRYRLTLDFPLNGQAIDKNEWYLKVNNEYLNKFISEKYDLEIRLTPVLGYVFTDNNKLEFGLDYRLNDFLDNPSRQRFWLALNWYIII
ncbi:DUF2490 domain-containing protein [uncultured Lacinutrix sp.]|uniref:DUF2490 domain-containing protein n=1 Tax=uncultured Lacinutrix sp. TaxID=574032 RepID=UPI0026031FEF|nr:DUF2490 domain-containing protein [uncultured Lacinutrix sp.]